MSLLVLSTSCLLDPAYVSPYQWENLFEEDGRYYYYEEDELSSRFGIDVSEHQGIIDWQAVAEDGVEFAFIRVGNRGATEGQLYVDQYFAENMMGATQAGIPIGAYFFSQAIDEEEAREEAEFVLQQLDGWELSYPVAFDHEPVIGVEGRANNLSSEQLSACAQSFCEILEEAGYETMLYANRNDAARFSESLFENRALWVAEYEVSHPTIEQDFTIWQYTSSGRVQGITTLVDLNIQFIPRSPES